jgi:1-acyl-sn-glycerol-3-phosphate acyltransferase
VVVANHESFVDILLISHLPFEMKWLSKAEFFKFPLVGWLMTMAGDIPLDRSSGRSAVKALKQCRVMLDRRVSVIIFPEGTRSESGELQEFKDGAFRLAVDAGVPIIPLAVHGTKTALRKHDWRYGRARAEVRILEPISTEGLTKRDVPALRDRVRDRIATELETMRADESA